MSVPSVAIAKDRLKNLLMSDRIQCTQDMTERLSKDLYQVIAKYMELDPGRDSLFRCFFHMICNVKRQPVSEKSTGFPSAGSTAGKNQS